MRIGNTLVLSLLLFSSSVSAFDIIAHRGASGYLPEHTLEAAILAYGQAPDYIEQDLVLSKDGELIVLHDIHLETVTNVETVFPNRARDDGRWYAIDFTLEELKQLSVHERQNAELKQVHPGRYQGQHAFTVATFKEHLALILELNRSTGQNIGLYPEVKAPAFHQREGADISAVLINTLKSHELNHASSNIIVQCFDFEEVKRLRTELGLKTKLVQLIGENAWNESDTDYDWLRSNEGLETLKNYVDGLGPWYPQLFQKVNDDGSVKANNWVKQAAALGFIIHPYTFRTDALPENMDESRLLDNLVFAGASGVFTDQVPPVKSWRNQKKPD